tara:strand:+ start:146 stop:400 length:255 start_codon:yes stop_codon:yes gene_type:complete
MPLSTIGGRDYYTNAVEVTITNSAFSDVPPTTKAIYFATADDYDIKFDNGVEIELSPTAGQITNIIPSQIRAGGSSNRTIHYLF